MQHPPNTRAVALCTEYSIRAFGGTEVLVAELIRGLSRYFKIVLVSRDTEEAIQKSEFGPLLFGHVPWDLTQTTRKEGAWLAARLSELGVSLAHFHFGGNYGWSNRELGMCPLLRVREAGIPCISTTHGVFALLDGYCAPYRPLWMKLALLPPAWLSRVHVLQHVEMDIAVSRHDLGLLQRWYRPWKSKFRQVYHSQLKETEETPRDAASREKMILCVGTIGHRKGQTILAEAFARIAGKHPEWKLFLAGRVGEPELLEQICKTRSDAGLVERIELEHQLSHDEIVDLLNRAAIFAMPSVHEGLGLSLQEALFHGCPAVGSRVGGIPELIDDRENGLLVEPGNVEQLANALDKLISQPELRGRFAANARPSIIRKGMTSDRMIHYYRELYDSLLAER